MPFFRRLRCAIAFTLALPVASAAAATVAEFPVPTSGHGPLNIAAAPGGSLWFSEAAASGVGTRTLGGAVSETSGLSGVTSGIAVAPGGDVWMTEPVMGKVAPLTPGGTLTEYSVIDGRPADITPGRDGNMWYTESSPSRIAKVTPDGAVTNYAVTTNPLAITTGPDGNLWFTEHADPGRIGRLTPDAPTATTQAATGIALTSATLTGTSDPNGEATTYHFRLGPTASYGQQAPAFDAAVGSDSADHALTQTLTGLQPGTTYHHRLVATSAAGTTDGADMSLVTPAQPPTPPASPPLPIGGRPGVAHVVARPPRVSAPRVHLWCPKLRGRISVRGRNSVATARGAEWETIDTDRGTRTVVKQGKVSVRDLHRHKSRVVRGGHTYLAAALLPSNRLVAPPHLKADSSGAVAVSVKVPGRGRVDVLVTAWRDNVVTEAKFSSAAVARLAGLLQPTPGRFVFARAHATAQRAATLQILATPNQLGAQLVA